MLHVHPKDIWGASPSDPLWPYLKADGIVNIYDAAPIGIYWLQVVLPSDPTSDLARADIDGDGYVSIIDAAQIGIYWMQTWTHNPPPWNS